MTDDTFAQKARALEPAQYRSFRRAVETGKFPDGQPVSKAQRELMLQAIILYERENLPDTEQSGYLPDACASRSTGSKAVEGDRGGRLIARSSVVRSVRSVRKGEP